MSVRAHGRTFVDEVLPRRPVADGISFALKVVVLSRGEGSVCHRGKILVRPTFFSRPRKLAQFDLVVVAGKDPGCADQVSAWQHFYGDPADVPGVDDIAVHVDQLRLTIGSGAVRKGIERVPRKWARRVAGSARCARRARGSASRAS